MLDLNKIYCGDCLELMKELPDGCVDLVFADFPYGNNTNYGLYQDTQENLVKLISKVIPELLRIGKVVAVTVGTMNLFHYPPPTWTLAWFVPAGTGYGKWGFCCWQPILVYGVDPYLKNRLGSRPDAFVYTETSFKGGHPCSKPLKVMEWIIQRCSVNPNDIILDPFAGSGTTLVAAKELRRQFIGIDIEQKYVDIARERLKQEVLAL